MAAEYLSRAHFIFFYSILVHTSQYKGHREISYARTMWGLHIFQMYLQYACVEHLPDNYGL